MTPLFTKLNLGLHRTVLVVGAPDDFEQELAALRGVTVHSNPLRLSTIDFSLAFLKTLAEVEAVAAWLPKMRSSRWPTRNGHPSALNANSIETTAGPLWARRASRACDRWRSIPTGLQSGSAARSPSSR